MTLSFAGKKSRKRGEWAFRYEQSNFNIRRKELFPLSRSQIKRKTTLAGATQTGTPFHFRRAPECGVANPVRARTVAPRSRTLSFIDRQTFRQCGESRSAASLTHSRLKSANAMRQYRNDRAAKPQSGA